MSLKEKDRMARFKIEDIKELEIELKELQSEIKPELQFIKLMLKMLRLNCENEQHFSLKILLKTKNDTNPILIKSLTVFYFCIRQKLKNHCVDIFH